MGLMNNTNGAVEGRVVFYDVEDMVLSILRKEFESTDLEIFVSKDESETKKILKKNDIDIVISDFNPKKPKIIEFFKSMKKQFPSVNRIILCESEYEQLILNYVLKNIVTSFFEKPHGIGEILSGITHIIQVRNILKNKKLIKLLSSLGNLNSFLEIYYDITQAIEQGKSNKQIAAILEKDISVATQVLKIANSAFYRTTRTGSVERACVYLGMETIKNIVFTVSLSRPQKLNSLQKKAMERIIYHSLKVNQNYQRFFKLETGKTVHPDQTSIGITHDIGKIIMLQGLPDRFNKVYKYMKKNPEISFYRSEIELGFEGITHAEIGAFFLDMWNFPGVNIFSALFHHTPEESFESYREMMDIFSFVNEFAK